MFQEWLIFAVLMLAVGINFLDIARKGKNRG
jgi:hypothetical protein